MDQHSSAIEIFCCYAREDEDLLDKLRSHLSPLRKQNLIDVWHDGDIRAGGEWEEEIKEHLDQAHIILLLLSADFINSDYCYDTEMKRALERHERKEARVIPIILRPVLWRHILVGKNKLGSLQALPKNGKPITTWDNQDEACVAIAQELHRIIESPPPGPPRSKVERDQRKRLLKRVRRILLEQSLHQAALINLYFQEEPRAVENPLLADFLPSAQVSRSLPPTTTITQVYDEADGQLLILGEPGAGKTTLLLELARYLLGHAQNDEHHPIPVLLNLCSWVKKRQPLSNWLVEELRSQYGGHKWVDTESLLPLLDGLDEVAEQYRRTCIEAINGYLDEHGDLPMVVCSRSKDYPQQSVRLQLQKAVVIEPLTDEQIDDYLTQLGEQGKALREALQKDTDLQELATTPFMLSILERIAQDTSLSKILSSDSLDAKRQQIFDTYVDRALVPRQKTEKYTKDQTRRWLAKLARQLVKDNQTVFYIERMQFNWLEKEQSDGLTRTVLYIFRCIIGVSIAGSAALSSDLLGALIFGLIGFFLVHAGLVKEAIEPAEDVIWSWTRVKQQLSGSIIYGSGIGLLLVFSYGLFSFLITSVTTIMLAIGLFIIQSGWTSRHFDKQGLKEQYLKEQRLIKPNQGIRRSWHHGLIIGLIFAVVSFFVFSLSSSDPVDGLVRGLVMGLAAGLLNGGIAGIQHLALRWYLWSDKSIPWHYSRFLDYAAERMLLRKVGGGYLFVHQLLQDYFANWRMPSPPK